MFTINLLATESYINNPFAGEGIALIDTRLILGINNPLLFEVTSRTADASGAFVPIPTPCEKEKFETKNNIYMIGNSFFINLIISSKK